MADASFRCYYRIAHSQGSFVLMTFPPAKEDGERILKTAEFFLSAGVRVPSLYAQDIGLGLILQEDMGSVLLAHRNAQKMDISVYRKALDELMKIQKLNASSLGIFTPERMLQEMSLFTDWFIGKWFGTSSPLSASYLQNFYESLVALMKDVPQSCVHCDFHSRNLCILPDDAIGVLDYQDALQGHFCYDIACLLQDAYIRLPNEKVRELYFYWLDGAMKIFALTDKEEVRRQFHLISIQRMLKVCGIFSRLYFRDGKSDYLKHIPLVMDYLHDAVITAANAQGEYMQRASSFLTDFLRKERPRIAVKIQETFAAARHGGKENP